MFWHNVHRRFTSPRSLLRAFALAVLMMASTGGGVAHAGTDAYCTHAIVGVNEICPGPQHTLTSNRATNWGAGAGCAGAFNYGSYYCADPTGCHTYTAGYLLYPAIRHRSTTSPREMSGNSTWGSTGVGSGCVAGTPYAVVGPVDNASAYLTGVPVFERPTVTAPDDVAALVPAADPTKAREFHTSHGAAYVLTDPSLGNVCLIAADGDTGYGMSCQRYGVARDQGMVATFSDADDKSAAGDTVIALPPAGVDDLTVTRTDGSERQLAAVSGVVTATLSAKDATVGLDVSPDANAGVTATQMSLGSVPVHKAHHAKARHAKSRAHR